MPLSKGNVEYQKKYQKTYKRKNKPSQEKSYYKKKEFICFDGETENNKYTLLGNSENYIYNKKGISTWDCINFLWNEGKGKIKIIYAIHFDIQYWIKDLSDDEILDLLDGYEIEYYCYKLRYFTKKFLMIRRGSGTIYIFDLLPFFQKSFLATVEQMKLDLSKRESQVLERGKKLRSKGFKSMNKRQIIEYNKIECQVAEKIAIKLRNILLNVELNYNGKKFNLYPKRFYGSGAIAKKILTNLGINKLSDLVNKIDNKIYEGIKLSYYGGRFEVFQVGTFNTIFKYDINSAYPYAMTKINIPKNFSISNYRKSKLTHFNFVDKNIYLVEWDFKLGDKNLLGILPFRRKDGYVLFPKVGKGYYFGIEAKYLNYLCKKTIGIFSVTKEIKVTFHETPFFPTNFINEIYEKRRELKELGDITQIAYKYAINSLYGKLAQQTGIREFTNIYIASWITAKCRSMILDVLFKNNLLKNIIQISTDGIFVNKKISNIDTGTKLGQWECDKFKKGQILGSGLYSLTARKTKYALRGIDVTKQNFDKIITKLDKSHSAKIFYNAFIGHKFALANHIKYGKFRLQFTKIQKTISLYDYQKRLFLQKKGIKGISKSFWIDIFQGGKPTMSNKLKKFDELLILEDEAINLTTK